MSVINLDLPILEHIKDLQSQHGLKYENYQRYRSYCSRRLYRLRRSLNVHEGVGPSVKARHQRARKLMDISNAMVLKAGEKDHEYAERMLLIPLCLAERAWAYAMQLKQEVVEQPRKRYHLVRRLKKASDYAERFEKLCHDPESPCSDRTKKEAVAYAAYITGLYKLERELWAEAKEKLNQALTIYFTLCIPVRDEIILERYRQRIDELRASLRYCAFNLEQKDMEIAVKLPNVLKFHDLAFKHAEAESRKLPSSSPQSPMSVEKDTSLTKAVKKVAIVEHKKSETEKEEEQGEEEDEDEDKKSEDQDDDDDEFDDADDNPDGDGSEGGQKGLQGWVSQKLYSMFSQ